MLEKRFIRDGNRRIIASVTNGYSDTSAIVRDERNQIAGRTSERFKTARDVYSSGASDSTAATDLPLKTSILSRFG
jgi:hypothetical protein